MPKNIVICCDGTGNEVGAREYSNVAKLYMHLDKRDATRQIAFYDPGLGTLGTSGFRTRTLTSLTRLMGLAFGYGLRDNIKDAYLFLMHHYEPGDWVFLFGFSRGAYTARALGGMIHRVGLLNTGNENLVEHALKRYFESVRPQRRRNGGLKNKCFAPFRREPDWKGMARFKKYFSRRCHIHFLGVWDTVKSVGVLRRSMILPHTADMNGVQHGRHAVALNEKRSKYRTNLWSRENGSDFAQVWFAGAHSDIGGGYVESSLSDIALEWMLVEAAKFGLLVDTSRVPPLRPDAQGKTHNPLLPFWWLLGWYRRYVPLDGERPAWIHDSVRQRRALNKRFDRLCGNQLPESVIYVRTHVVVDQALPVQLP
jgi:uncharacterized protein (DUF2235 family)